MVDGGDADVGPTENDGVAEGLRALARAMSTKDVTISRHSERVAALAAALAEAADWPPGRVVSLRAAAFVHDVGKLGVPDALLTKNGPLDEREQRQMQEHVELSATIVRPMLSDEQVGWIHAHHERPDGLGYPLGLSGAEIPDGAGLIALADAWDVMTSGRVYSPPKSAEQSYREVLSLAGKQFTGTAVDSLQALWRAGKLTSHD